MAAAAVGAVRRAAAAPRVLPLPRLQASATSSGEVASALRSHGVVVIEKAVAPEVMDQVVSETSEKSGIFYGAVGSFAGHHTTRNAGKPLGESKAVQALAVQPLVLGAVEALLRPWCRRVSLGTCSAISVQPPPTEEEAPAPPQAARALGQN